MEILQALFRLYRGDRPAGKGIGMGKRIKFIHIADVHLGASPDRAKEWSAGRGKELWKSFRRLLELVEKENIDLLLIAGDLFHRQPLLRELKEVDYLFSKLTHTHVILIAGNHDYLKKDSYLMKYEWSENVHCLFEAYITGIYIEELDIEIFGFSYDRREITLPLADFMKKCKEPKRRNTILLAHGGDEKHLPFGRNDIVDAGFTYIALGHIHKPAVVVENLAAYSGALEPLDSNETGAHGFIKGEIKDGACRFKFCKFACREYLHLKLKVEACYTNMQIEDMLKRWIEEIGRAHV